MSLADPTLEPPENPQPNNTHIGPPAVDSDQQKPIKKRTRRRWLWYVLLYLFIILTVGTLAFVQGRQSNLARQQDDVLSFLQEQFNLGLEDLQAEQYELARQRFEAIARYDPTFPGIEDILVEIYLVLNLPTITPTAEPTPTPDPSPPDQLYEQAQAALANGEWTLVIDKLLSLRAKDPAYRAVEADGMMYIALRNRGMYQISQGLMEEGLYDLSLAERFGPLDREANFSRTLAQQYLLANSYLGVNWLRAADLFGPLCQQGATLDSCFKFADAAWFYADQLIAASDPCAAIEYYDDALSAWKNPTRAPTATEAANICATATAPPPQPTAPPESPTPETTLTAGPTPTETITPTPEPTATPTPGF
jgi:hypothetical protein